MSISQIRSDPASPVPAMKTRTPPIREVHGTSIIQGQSQVDGARSQTRPKTSVVDSIMRTRFPGKRGAIIAKTEYSL